MAVAAITDLVASLGSALSVVEAEDRSEWSGPARAARVLELRAAVERLQAELVRAVGDWDRDHAWQADESTSAETWLADRASMAPIAAARLVRTARLARRYDRVGKALAAGEVTVAQVDELARVANRREELFTRDVDVLVDAARSHSPAELELIARRWRHLADDARPNDEPAQVYARRFLHASPTFHGTVRIDGELDPEGGAVLLAALDRHDTPDAPNDPLGARTLAQRRADAIVDIASDSLRGVRAGERPRPAAELLIDPESLVGTVPANLPRARCDLAGVGPIPVETARRLLCDSVIGRVVASPSEVLDVGRRVQFPTAAQRRAVIARDEHCVWPDCARPARWCDVHHVVPVRQGGRTEVASLVLLCRRHHTAVHELGWTISRAADGTLTVKPPPTPGRRRPVRRWSAERAPP